MKNIFNKIFFGKNENNNNDENNNNNLSMNYDEKNKKYSTTTTTNKTTTNSMNDENLIAIEKKEYNKIFNEPRCFLYEIPIEFIQLNNNQNNDLLNEKFKNFLKIKTSSSSSSATALDNKNLFELKNFSKVCFLILISILIISII
jgi:hypothetical protein